MSITVEDLQYTYVPGTPFSHTALSDVNLTIEDGEFVGLIGHTGSGKSTLIQIMSGLIRPMGGRVLVGGQDIFAKNADKMALRRTVGVVFQYPEYQLFEESIQKDIEFGPRKTGVPESELQDRVMEAMALVDLDYETYKDISPFELSGGQKRKVAIAGVLAMRPQVLILDEPIAGLDPQGRTALMELLRVLNRNGVTIVIVSHNMDGLAEYATRIVAMKEGRVHMNGTPAEVFSQHDRLREAGLDLPQAARMVELLRARGWDIPAGIIRYGELRDWLRARLGGGAA